MFSNRAIFTAAAQAQRAADYLNQKTAAQVSWARAA
jgi:antirestriction protein ArdC